MTHPANSKKLEFENDTLSINFSLEPKWIGFTMLNKSNDGIKINWDEVSFSINGQAHRAVHKETGILTINMVQPPTTIPQKSSLVDYLIPSSGVVTKASTSYLSGPTTTFKTIFPTYDYGQKKEKKKVEALRGTRITIYMPFYIAGKYVSNYYDFMIDDIITHKKNPQRQ